jgi:hypothetical protein
MSLTIGTQLCSHEIAALLGRGLGRWRTVLWFVHQEIEVGNEDVTLRSGLDTEVPYVTRAKLPAERRN